MNDLTALRRFAPLGHLLFWPAFTVWTWKLISPNPVPETVASLLSWLDVAQYLVAKTLHLLGNTYLTLVLAWWVPARRAPLLLAVVLMMVHGMATEIIQTFVPNRSGRALDVLIDWAGVWLGVLVGWRWWKPLFRTTATPDLSISSDGPAIASEPHRSS